MLLEALTPVDRVELRAEVARLSASGRWNDRTASRLAALALALGRPSLRAAAVDRWHAADCDCLAAGYVLLPVAASIYGEHFAGALSLALRELQDAPPPAASPEPEADAEPPLLPEGMAIDGIPWERASLDGARPGATEEQRRRRAQVAEAIEAHREGRLGEWAASRPWVSLP